MLKRLFQLAEGASVVAGAIEAMYGSFDAAAYLLALAIYMNLNSWDEEDNGR